MQLPNEKMFYYLILYPTNTYKVLIVLIVSDVNRLTNINLTTRHKSL